MSTHYGEGLATLLDKGLNLLPLLPDDHITGVGASYFGDGGILKLEQSPYLEDAFKARLRILGVIGGMGTYGDENRSAFALSNNIRLPDGTRVHLQEPRPEKLEPNNYRLSEAAIEASYDVTNFLRTVEGNLSTAKLRFEARGADAVSSNVSGGFDTDEMKAAYLETIGQGVIVGEEISPATAESVICVTHTVLTPTIGRVVTFLMHDYRPDSREAMLRLQQDQTRE